MLNSTGYWYKVVYEVGGKKISHWFYMDDRKTYVINVNQQEGLLKTIKTFSDDICMQFSLAKGPLGQDNGLTGTSFQPVGTLKASNRNTVLHATFLIQETS